VTTWQPSHHETTIESGRPSTRALLRRGTLAGAAASAGTTAGAGIARAADISLQIDDAVIPIAAFALWTLVGAALGILLAGLLRTRRRFLVVTVVATGLSLIPPIALPDDAATSAVLVAAHLLAAAIIIPALSRALATVPAHRGARDR
jgi:uncharacterized protein DUF6069